MVGGRLDFFLLLIQESAVGQVSGAQIFGSNDVKPTALPSRPQMLWNLAGKSFLVVRDACNLLAVALSSLHILLSWKIGTVHVRLLELPVGKRTNMEAPEAAWPTLLRIFTDFRLQVGRLLLPA
jgi:hypothetical protein